MSRMGSVLSAQWIKCDFFTIKMHTDGHIHFSIPVLGVVYKYQEQYCKISINSSGTICKTQIPLTPLLITKSQKPPKRLQCNLDLPRWS